MNAASITALPQTHTLQSDVLPPLSLRISNFTDPKEYDRFLKNCVALTRRSYEYSLWVKYVKQTLGHNFCALTGEVSTEVTIDIHHHPFTLYDIVECIVNKHVIAGTDFCSADILVEALELHYSNRVGYIPLCSTLHEKFHSGALTLPITLVHGDWNYILDNYPVSDTVRVKVEKYASIMTSNHKGWSRDNYVNTSSGN